MPQNNSLKLKEDFPPVTTAEWNEVIRKDLKGAEPSKLLWKTEEGISGQALLSRRGPEGLGAPA